MKKLHYDKNIYKEVRELISAFESGIMSIELMVNEINKLCTYSIDKEEFLLYYDDEFTLDECIRFIITPEIEDWQDITDSKAVNLIKELIDNLDDVYFQRISHALEKRYFKSRGTISDYIFHSDMREPKEILKRLKNDTTIYL